MIRLICARCRYECQTELQRVICPRCASIIDTPVEPPGSLELLEMPQSQGLPYLEDELDLNSNLQDRARTGRLEPATAAPIYNDDVLDLPDLPLSEHSDNEAFNGAYNPAYSDQLPDEIVLDEPIALTMPRPPIAQVPEREDSHREPRVIRLSEPKRSPPSAEPFFLVPKQRFASLQGRSWRGPVAIAAITFAGFGLYSLQGRVSPAHPASQPPSPAAVAKKNVPTPLPPAGPASGAASGKASPTVTVQPTVIPAAKSVSNTASPAPTVTTKASRDLARTETKAEPKKNDRAANTPAAGDGKLTVQVASFPSEQEARERVTYLKSVGVPAQIVRADLGKRGIYFRVMTGRFVKPDEARKYGQELLSKGKVQEFVVARL